jgi:CopG family nickel-responsive transcriptional regulator
VSLDSALVRLAPARDIRWASLLTQQVTEPNRPCLGVLAYVFEHHTRDLARRLTRTQHTHHDLSVSTLRIHLDSHDSLEVAVLRGVGDDLQHFADSVTSQRGVRHGHLHIVPISPPTKGSSRK